MRWFAGMTFAVSLIATPAVALAQAAIDTKADTQKLADEWKNAYNQKDAAKIARMYAANGVLLWSRMDGVWARSDRRRIQERDRRRHNESILDNGRPVASDR